MNSPLASTRFVLASLCGLGLMTLALDSCGPTPTYTRTEVEGLGTGGVPGEGTGTGGQPATGTGGAAGGMVGTGGITSTGGTPAGGAGARPAGGAGGAIGGGPAGGNPGTGGVVATGGTAGGKSTGGSGAGVGGSGTGGVIATGGVVATGGVSSGGVTGTAGSGTGGVPATGGTSSGGAAGGKGGTVAVGGMGGGAATGGAGGGFAPPTVIDCSAPSVPQSGILSDFNRQPPATGRWASSNGLMGTVFAFTADTSSTATATVGDAPSDLHLAASVATNTYAGGGILFDSCQSIGSFTSIRFSVTGTNNCPIWLQVQTFNLKPNTDTPEGGCTTNCLNYPTVQNVAVSPSPVTVPLSSFSPWSSTLAGQVVGVYWFLNTLSNKPACTADLHFDDITLVP